MTQNFPYKYAGCGYFRKKDIPIGQVAPMLHGMEAFDYAFNLGLQFAFWLHSDEGDAKIAELLDNKKNIEKDIVFDYWLDNVHKK